MPAIVVPALVPCPQSSTVQPEEGRLFSEADRAPRQARTIELDERQYQQLTFAFADEDSAAAFRDWWRVDLVEGGAWFAAPATWPTPEGVAVKVRRFIGAPAWSYLGVGVWRLSIDAEVRGETLLPSTPIAPPSTGGPWLFYPTESDGFSTSLAPMHMEAGGYSAITGAAEPFVDGVGAVDDDGFGSNETSASGVFIPLLGDSGRPLAGQYTWEPVDAGEGVEPFFTTENPSPNFWSGPNLFVGLIGFTFPWSGGVLTLFAGNDPVGGAGQTTIITYLGGATEYPPVSVYYG